MRPASNSFALAITPAQVAAVVKLVDDGKLSNKLARQVVEGVLAGEGEPEQVMTDRGLALVRDDSPDPGRSRRGAGRQPRCGGEDPGRQGAAAGRDRRRGDEGHQGPGRRGPGKRIGAGRLRLGFSPQQRHRCVGVFLDALTRIGVRVVDRQHGVTEQHRVQVGEPRLQGDARPPAVQYACGPAEVRCCRRCCAGIRRPAGTAGRPRRRVFRRRRRSC